LIRDNDAGPPPFHVQGAVVYRPFDREQAEGGSWCGADYTWSVTGTLTLPRSAERTCVGARGFIVTGD
jgi:hypothetical protein